MISTSFEKAKHLYFIEFINQLAFSGVLPHKISLKTGMSIMML